MTLFLPQLYSAATSKRLANFLNPKGHPKPISGSKVTAILLKEWIWSIGGVASARVCACSLYSILVLPQPPKKLLNMSVKCSCVSLFFIKLNLNPYNLIYIPLSFTKIKLPFSQSFILTTAQRLEHRAQTSPKKVVKICAPDLQSCF